MTSRMKDRLVMLNTLIILMMVGESEFSATRDAEIDQLLNKINKPAFKSIKSPDGVIIDCVHMKNHPIYDHPLFKNYTIKMRPTSYRETKNKVSLNTKKQSSMVTQLWRMNGRCPKNSIPIRRTRREDILRAESIKRYGKKDHKHVYTYNHYDCVYEHATLLKKKNVLGARAIINVWKPHVQTYGEFSVSQIWLRAGSISEFNSIEAGWLVNRKLFNDSNTRFSILWTANGYEDFCYNLDREGFVHVNKDFALGATLSHVSTLDGEQHNIPIQIWQDGVGDWWLKVYEHIYVGYWPFRLFNHLHNGADQVQWGGQIVNCRVALEHTSTQMGSGHFAEYGWKKASYFKNLEITNGGDIWKKPTTTSHEVKDEKCYNIKSGVHDVWGVYFYYGGPGLNPNCPI